PGPARTWRAAARSASRPLGKWTASLKLLEWPRASGGQAQGRTVTALGRSWQDRFPAMQLSTIFVDNSVQNFRQRRINTAFALGRASGARQGRFDLLLKIKHLIRIC